MGGIVTKFLFNSDRVIMCVYNGWSVYSDNCYWLKCRDIYNLYKPNGLVFWNDAVTEESEFSKKIEGNCSPVCLFSYLKFEKNFDLIITTDGKIKNNDIEMVRVYLSERKFTPKSVKIYYIGDENLMNLGLNVFFNNCLNVSYYVNEQLYTEALKNIDDLKHEELLNASIPVSTILNLQTIKKEPYRSEKVEEFRKKLQSVLNDLEEQCVSEEIEILTKLYQKDERSQFFKRFQNSRSLILNIHNKRLELFKMFDGLGINHTNSDLLFKQLPKHEEKLSFYDYESPEWIDFEDTITLDKFTRPCLLVQKKKVKSIVTDPDVLRHPLKLKPEWVISLFENNFINYSTYTLLEERNNNYELISPHTRVACKGVFVMACDNTDILKNNCRAFSTIFGPNNRVPGNLVLWNFIVMYLLYKHKFMNTDYEKPVKEEILNFCKRFKTNISLTHKNVLSCRLPLEICLWYSVLVAPIERPNCDLNPLRSTFGNELVAIYDDLYRTPENGPLLDELKKRSAKWAAWNYLITQIGKPNLYEEVAAQYQNWTCHKGEIVLLEGECRQRYKSPLNMIDPATAYTLFKVLEKNYTNYKNVLDKNFIDYEDALDKGLFNYEDVDSLVVTTPPVFPVSETLISDTVLHVKINPQTCWPYVICRVTGSHWMISRDRGKRRDRENRKNLQHDFYFKFFYTYCNKFKKYPREAMDLSVYFSKKTDHKTLSCKDILIFEYVFNAFSHVMNLYSCNHYLKMYKENAREVVRLSKE
ncbi:ORF4 [Agrotis segetum granulovirus]|uniref:ORF4 n=1 Tax=Agrotis segetum granulosis virus TaxID=10464 RepID=Q6QXC3_GVAS|nr:hypothetical protein AsGV004 [Agrotis segetum granulovirus]AAS82734.1 ORF4 [Agrotis segetum granulovirus]AHN92042.1 hypothetical protein AsGV003 [Agrotis segetum granulovirus]AKN63278.1 hypothetical protein AsGV004 [Agrotis segetum granulovirus]